MSMSWAMMTTLLLLHTSSFSLPLARMLDDVGNSASASASRDSAQLLRVIQRGAALRRASELPSDTVPMLCSALRPRYPACAVHSPTSPSPP